MNQFSSSNQWSVYKRVWKEFFQEFFFSRSYEIESKKSQTQVKRCNTVIWNAFFLLILAQEKEQTRFFNIVHTSLIQTSVWIWMSLGTYKPSLKSINVHVPAFE